MRIVILIISASTPLATIVGTAPLGFAFGGASLPATYLISGLLILLFCVGYTQMSRRITRPGAFYSYITRGIGRPAGVAAAWLALVSYTTFLAGCFGIAPYYASLILEQQLGIHVPWPLYALLLFLAVGVTAYRRIDFSAALLGLFVTAEVACLVVLDVVMIATGGVHLLPTHVFSPSVAFGPGVGVALVFAIMSFVGFESAALYAPEARNPRRTIPRATYIAVGVITVVYCLTTWLAVGARGIDSVSGAASRQVGDFFFAISDEYVGSWLTSTMAVLMLVAQFAVALAIANATARYTQALAKERLLPGWLGAGHPKFASPHHAVIALLIISAAFIFGGWMIGWDPYLDLSSVLFGFGVVGIVAIQAGACLSVILFFRKDSGFHWWKTLLAPAIGGIGLVAALILIVDSFSLVSGKDSPVVGALPWLLVVATIGGALYGLHLRRRHPERYELLGAGDTASEFDDVISPEIWDDPTPPSKPETELSDTAEQK
ncbi:APC family permease [Nocardia sp. NPDC052112]|uniref:APC family permease n=1 Tax=Nocardia sp. NPDC052112 TaxID=3155646 RepID=UPI003420EF4D